MDTRRLSEAFRWLLVVVALGAITLLYLTVFHANHTTVALTMLLLELVLAALLLGGWYLRPVAWVAAIYLFIAAAAVIKVERKWLWHISGCEYPIFWGLCCAIVAASAGCASS